MSDELQKKDDAGAALPLVSPSGNLRALQYHTKRDSLIKSFRILTDQGTCMGSGPPPLAGSCSDDCVGLVHSSAEQ